MKKYELYSIITISPMTDKDGAVTCLVNPLKADVSSAWDRFLRSAFLETAGQTAQRDYQPIVIGSRSIGATLIDSNATDMVKAQKVSKVIVKIVHVTPQRKLK